MQTQTKSTKRRLLILALCFLALFTSTWAELFLQRKQHLIGGGISRSLLFLLINVHIIVIVILLYLIIRQSIKLFVERRQNLPGSSFKKNLLFAFTFFSVLPSFFIFFTAGKFITKSIDDWFDARIGKGLSSSLQLHIAQTKNIRKELTSLGKSLLKNKVFLSNPTSSEISLPPSNKLYVWEPDGSEIRGKLKDEIIIWRTYRPSNDRSTKTLATSFLSLLEQNDSKTPFDFFGSLYWAKKYDENWIILVHRYPKHIREPLIHIQNSQHDYEQLKSMRNPIYRNYIFTFILVTLLILFLSIWCAFYLAKGLSTPIQDLLAATQDIRKGNYDTIVPYHQARDLKPLAQAFNNMSFALKKAYLELERKNHEMLIMLEHIKASVFFVNKFGRITTYNRAAKELVHSSLNISRFKNKKLRHMAPRIRTIFFSMVKELNKKKTPSLSKEHTFTINGNHRTFMVHMTNITTSKALKTIEKGLLIVIEDLTDIVKNSTSKTWQQAAKQVAHEIKNPLTPIQLATQRLQRKFCKQLNQDPAFMHCTQTILNQVNIMKDLASHFSAFASMPTPTLELIDLNGTIEQLISLYQLSYPSIHFTAQLDKNLLTFKTDKKKIKRVLTNLLDNSVRALLQNDLSNKRFVSIKTYIKQEAKKLVISITDSGPGIDESVRKNLFLPHVSSQKKNMGLGLAIVHDITVQLGGSIKLAPVNQGACFHVTLPIR